MNYTVLLLLEHTVICEKEEANLFQPTHFYIDGLVSWPKCLFML